MLSDEERKAIERLKDLISKSKVIGDIEINKQVAFKDIEMILNLIEKQSKEIERINEILIWKQKHEEQLQKEIEELKKENLEIRDWKYVIDGPIDLDKLKELDLIKIKGKEYVSKDKIKAKIEELKVYKTVLSEPERQVLRFNIEKFEYGIEVLCSLLEKE